MHHSLVSWEITLLYLFSWNFLSFGWKDPTKVRDYRLLTAHVKFHQIYTFLGSACWKYIKFHLKKYRGIMFHDIEEWCKIWRQTDLWFGKWHEEMGIEELKRNWLVISKLTWGIWQILTRALGSVKDFHFNGSLLSKVYIVLAKKVLKSYFSWHWTVMRNLKKNWLVVRKMTWWIWQVFTRALESLKIGTLMRPFYPK